MKIGFPVLKKAPMSELEFNLNLHSSKFFGVFDSSDQSIKLLGIDSVADESKGMALMHFLKSEKIAHIISPQFHPMAARFFQNNNIGVHLAKNVNVIANLSLFKNNELVPFGAEHIVQKAGCQSSCNSCSSTCNEKVQDIVYI